MRNILFVLFVVNRIVCTGRVTPFTGRRAVALYRKAKRGVVAWVDWQREQLAYLLILASERLRPIPQGTLILSCESPIPYGWGSVELKAPRAKKPRKAAQKSRPTAQPKGKRDPLREQKFQEVRFHVSCGDSVKAACKTVGVAESSYRSWAKKKTQDSPDRCRTGEGV